MQWASQPSVQRILGILVFLTAWQTASGWLINAYYASTPIDIARYIADWAASGELWMHLYATLFSTLLGFAGGSVAGVALALLLSSNPFLNKVFYPMVFVLFSLPKVVLAPLLILWVGVGSPPAILLALITAFFMVFFNVYTGLRSVPAVYLDTAAIMGAGWRESTFKFRLPAAAPFVAVGLHQGLVYAFHGAILGEMTASDTGIGYAIVYAATSMDAAGVIAGLAIIGAICYVLTVVLRRVTVRRDIMELDGVPA